MEKLDRVLQAELESLESQLTYLINCRHTKEIELQKDIIKAMIISKHAGIQACQEPSHELTKENIEKIKNGSHTTLYTPTPKRLGVEEIEVIIKNEGKPCGNVSYQVVPIMLAQAIHAAIYGGE